MSMSKIKKFFSRKKDEAAFKLKLGGGFGHGHALNAPSSSGGSGSEKRRNEPEKYVPPKHKELSAEARAAADAALARIECKDRKDFNTSLAAIKAQAKRELENERQQKNELEAAGTTKEAAPVEKRNLACDGVFFRCPMVSDEVLTKKEWKTRIKDFLYQQLEHERGLTACLIICNCNTKEKATECIQTLSKYLENIINHPDEEKYCKIRMSNRIFSEKVRNVEGALDFLMAAGFTEVELDGEAYLIYSKDNVEAGSDLNTLLEGLTNAESISLTLDRNIKVLLTSQVRYNTLPDDFYRITPEEIKREQQLRTEALEQAQVLKTKAMREREEQRNLRIYRYALVRVKFPNGIYIQGTFNVYEKISDIYEFVQSCLNNESMEFTLAIMGEGCLSTEDMDKTIYDMRLIPNVTFLFMPLSTSSTSSQVSVSDTNYLNEELLMLVTPMEA